HLWDRFGGKIEFVHAINMMPFTPITEELLLYPFMELEWPVLNSTFSRDGDPVAPQWAGYIHLGQAVVTPRLAWENLCALNVFDAANSKTNSLYWIATRADHGEAPGL
ncbi:unnamed protein product, partial [Discosporangium mesarthrocarpum]